MPVFDLHDAGHGRRLVLEHLADPGGDGGDPQRAEQHERQPGEEQVEETWLTVPGNYPAYYAGIRDALNGNGENPVPARQAIQIMELIELGIESAKHRSTLCLA